MRRSAVAIGAALLLAAGVGAWLWQRNARDEFAADRGEYPDLPLDCSALAPPAPAVCARQDDAIARLVRVASSLRVGTSTCGHDVDFGADRDAAGWRARAGGVLAEIQVMRPETVPTTERIVAQNAALRIARCAPRMDGNEAERAALADLALSVVAALALPADDLAALGSEPHRDIAAWLGGSLEPLRLTFQPSLHARGYGLTREIRSLRSSELVANVSQLVAIDQSGAAHLTPIVGELEIRRPASGPTRRVCAAELDIDALRCGASLGLRVPSLEELRARDGRSDFLRVGSSGLRCNGCHKNASFNREVIPEPSRNAELAAHGRATLEQLSRELAPPDGG